MYNVIFYNNDLTANHSKSNLRSLKTINSHHFEKRGEFLLLMDNLENAKKLDMVGRDSAYYVICDESKFKPSFIERPFYERIKFVSMDLSDIEKSTELVKSFKGQPIVSFSESERWGLFENSSANISPSVDFLVSLIKKLPEDLREKLSNTLYEMPLKSLKSLRNGSFMFKNCNTFEDFNYDLPKLEEAFLMFAFSSIKKWNKPIPKLEYGGPMSDILLFIKTMGEDLGDDFNSLEDLLQNEEILEVLLFAGLIMYMYCNCGMFHKCEELESFCGDLSSLKYGTCMFAGCSSLTSFKGDLSNLRYGLNMFGPTFENFNADDDGGISIIYYNDAPKLDAESVMYILFSLSTLENVERIEFGEEYEPLLRVIKDLTEGVISIGINATENTKDDFAQEVGFENFEALNEAFAEKNWIVQWYFVNEEESTTYNLRRNMTKQPNKVYTKLIEINPKFEIKNRIEKLFNLEDINIDKLINFQSEDGSKLYHLSVINDTNTPDNYDRFESLEEAIDFYKIVPRKIEK